MIATLAVVSLDRWDTVWRRPHHLAVRLVASGAVSRILFLEPPERGLAPRARRRPAGPDAPGIEVVTPPLLVPRSAPGGYRLLDAWLARALRGVDALWINDAASGLAAWRPGIPAVHDVTDDWRSMPQPARDRARTVAAEDVLAGRVPTVVCSAALADRWRERYGVQAHLVPNGVDVAAIRTARARTLDGDGEGPHAVYVGTAHPNRIDTALLEDLARRWPGTVHLVGPRALPAEVERRLAAGGVRLVGPVPSTDVPEWLVSADVLICPHVVDAFTLSLDAIKAHEYLATDRPVVATPSSGFQTLAAPGLTVVAAPGFVDAAIAAVGGSWPGRTAAVDWDERARAFAEDLASG